MSQASNPSGHVSPVPPAAHALRSGDPEIDALVTALYEVATISRRLTHDDPVEPAAARVLAHVRRLTDPRPSELAADMKLDLSTVSRHVRALETSGHLTTRPDAHDRRAQRVVLTDDGSDAVDQVVRNRCAAVQRAVSHWDPADRSALATLLHRLGEELAADQARLADRTDKTTAPTKDRVAP
jgi:DNA-binding MarR family transcriptional regulator